MKTYTEKQVNAYKDRMSRQHYQELAERGQEMFDRGFQQGRLTLTNEIRALLGLEPREESK